MLNINLKTVVSLVIMSLASHSVWAEDSLSTPTASIPPAIANTPVVAPTPQVARAAFTTGITDREPDSQLATISAGQTVYYFTELVGLQGHVITHRWEKDGELQLGLQFPVGGQRWRVHSSKTISPNLPGKWTVIVQDSDGSVLHQDTLIVEPIIPAAVPADTALIPAPAPATTPVVAAPPPVTPPATVPEKSKQAIWDTLQR
ncbi:DUF2914 domain-containing protein [Thiothrix lacustris]|uniref:DUF2914 domain-containing protein n=1 Tax=Thiothrix lacustris TaxID=525917 RepID=UPI000684D035|nr:DUF2914 domain-containing protein [Thiothrix lacustris]